MAGAGVGDLKGSGKLKDDEGGNMHAYMGKRSYGAASSITAALVKHDANNNANIEEAKEKLL